MYKSTDKYVIQTSIAIAHHHEAVLIPFSQPTVDVNTFSHFAEQIYVWDWFLPFSMLFPVFSRQ